MRFSTIAAAAVAGLGLAACVAPKTEEAKPVADARFDYAANFTCEGGAKLDIVFNGNDGVLARVDGGATLELPMDPGGTTGPTWKSETATLVLDGPGATWTSAGKTSPCTFESRSLPPPSQKSSHGRGGGVPTVRAMVASGGFPLSGTSPMPRGSRPCRVGGMRRP